MCKAPLRMSYVFIRTAIGHGGKTPIHSGARFSLLPSVGRSSERSECGLRPETGAYYRSVGFEFFLSLGPIGVCVSEVFFRAHALTPAASSIVMG